MKLLIIEGPDRCGKNTLIKNLTSQAENYVVRHFGSAKGKTDYEKRDYQFQFFKKEFSLANLRPQFTMPDNIRYPNDIWIWNRAHIGEYVYGKMYRNTDPEGWVMKMETMFGMDIDPSIYLLMLEAPAEFLCKNDDGLSFTNNIKEKQKELVQFKIGFEKSKIMNKKVINVTDGENYRSSETILKEVNNFLNNK
jgi:thymidylate kinase